MKVLTLFIVLLVTARVYGQTSNHTAGKPNRITGIASYYHPKFHGKKMANGDTYQHHSLSAASNVIPMHKWVKVTNIKNGRSVIVKITDRMARKNKRVIDLSYGAAQQLKMVKQGLAKVRIEILTNYAPPEK